MNILLLTSCNRIKQVLLSLSLNAQTIKEKFSVIIVDNSTPNISSAKMCLQHSLEDPYNFVKPYNYCSDLNLLYDAHKLFNNIEEFKVIHCSPRSNKQLGESNMISLGLTQAALMGKIKSSEKNYCLKITGTSILLDDVLSQLPNLLQNKDLMVWRRTHMSETQRSSRIFGCDPNVVSKIILDEIYNNFVDDAKFMEDKIADIGNKINPERLYYTKIEDKNILLEGGQGMDREDGKKNIENFIKNNNIKINNNPYIKEFMDGGIW